MFIEVSHAGFPTVRSRDSVSSCPLPESPDPESLNPRAQNPKMLNLNLNLKSRLRIEGRVAHAELAGVEGVHVSNKSWSLYIMFHVLHMNLGISSIYWVTFIA